MGQRLPGQESKTGNVLDELLTGRKFTRFDAERELHDHVLNTTVSILQLTHGVKICRERITVSGYQGRPTNCCLYWMEPEEINRIKKRRVTFRKKEAHNSNQTEMAFI